jgi:excisionase family DNA binding protein
MIDNYLTVYEASKILGIHQDTLKRLCRQGDIKATKLRNTWLIQKDDLDQFKATYNPKKGKK